MTYFKFAKQIFIFSLALLWLFSAVPAFSPLGGDCNYSRDCSQGYCNQSICKIPDVVEEFSVVGVCNATIDCGNGFCMSGECILPKGMSFSTFSLGAGLQSSCAGIIENCTGIWCMFCNVTWILLVVGSAAAGFVTRKSGRMLPLLLFALPLLIGIIFFPFIGFILAVIEIFLISFLKPALMKVAMENLLVKLKPQAAQSAAPQEKSKDKKGGDESMEQLPFD